MNFEYDQAGDRLVLMVIRALMAKYNVVGFEEEDFLQEGRIALWKAKETYQAQSKAKFETYASAVIRNRIVDYIRTQKGMLPEQFLQDKNGTEIEPADKTPVDPVFREILNEVLKEHCDKLERAIFNAYYQGYSYQEICKIFEISKKKVDNTIQNIHRLARSIYAD